MRAVAEALPDAGGGTRLGELLKQFLDRWGQRGTARGAVVVVMSDGWERGDATLLGEQMARLQRLAHRVVWSNPRKAAPGYAPLAAGMAASLPSVDDFVEGHSLAALEHLADVVLGRARSHDAQSGSGSVRDIAPQLRAWVEAGTPVRAGHDHRHLGQLAAPGRRRDGCQRHRRGGRQPVRRLRRGRGLRDHHRGAGQRRARVGPLRLQRRRGLRRRPDLRRDPRRPRAAGRPRAARPGAGPGARRRAGRASPPSSAARGSSAPSSSSRRTARSGSLGDPGLDHAVLADARGMLSTGQTGTRHYGVHGERRVDDVAVFVSAFVPPPRMLVFGATDFAGAVSRIGVFLGYRVTVCDARPVFATATALPGGARGGLRLAAQVPGRAGRAGAGRRADRAVRPHPRPEVRRAAARGRAAHARPPTSASWAAGAPTPSGWRSCGRPG